MDATIETILEPGETIAWTDRIDRRVLALFLVIGLAVTLGVSGFLFTRQTLTLTAEDGAAVSAGGSVIGWAVLGIGLLFTLLSYFSSRAKVFAVTGKRIVIRSGLIGTDFKSIYYDQIQNLLVDVGIIGKLFSVGTVKIDTGKTETYSTGGGGGMRRQNGMMMGRQPRIRTRVMYDNLSYIKEPYEVYKKLQGSLSERKESLFSGRADMESQQAKKATVTS